MIAITRNLALATLAFGAAALPPQLSCKNAFDWDATRYLLVLYTLIPIPLKTVTDAHPADSPLATHTRTSKEHMATKTTVSSATS